VVLRKIIKLFW